MSRFVRMTRTHVINENGLEWLRLALWVDGVEKRHVRVISGVADRQNFRSLAHEVRGMLEPIPEGRYFSIGNPEWAGGVGNYQIKWSEALGAVVIEIYGERAIMLHIDGNVPGSAGCICPTTLAELKEIIAWWVEGKPDYLEVDYGLGTIAKPKIVLGKPAFSLVRHKFFAKPGKAVAYALGKLAASLALRLDYHDAKTGLALNGKQVNPADIESISVEVVLRQKAAA